jgi:NMD protein affecting ribosome stability and mRNA decay
MLARKSFTYSKRKSMDTSSDPYLSSGGLNGSSICKKCHAVFQKKRWTIDEDLYNQKAGMKSTVKVHCPACKKKKDRFPSGILKLKGDFLKDHRVEILNLVKNEEQRAMGFNPLERIIGVIDFESGIEITTTNEKLAQRIGKSLQRSYQGKVEYKWSSGTKLLRAEWTR